tara:strand:- start:70 stop:609 length:540 start_codon:yes stop_codon:yes gene_type:complete
VNPKHTKRLGLIFLLTLLSVGVKSQVLDRIDAGLTVKNDCLSLMMSYELKENAHFELTLPLNLTWAPGADLSEPGLYAYYGAVKYVSTRTIKGVSFESYPILIVFNSDQDGWSGPSTPVSLGLGLGKTYQTKGWSVRPELEFSVYRNLYSASGGMGQGSQWIEEYIYGGWPSVGITVKR